MHADDMLKVAQVLEANAHTIRELETKLAAARKQNRDYECEKAATNLVDHMISQGLIDDDGDKRAEQIELHLKLAQENPVAFNTKVEAVKLASQGPSFELSNPNSNVSATPGRTAFDNWIAGG